MRAFNAHPLALFGQRFVGARVYRSTAQTFTTGVIAPIQFDTTRFDTGQFFSTSANTKLVIRSAGYYWFGAQLSWAAAAGGNRQVRITLNVGATPLANTIAPSTGAATVHTLNVSGLYLFAAGDYIEMYGLQDSGGNLNTETGVPARDSEFYIARLG